VSQLNGKEEDNVDELALSEEQYAGVSKYITDADIEEINMWMRTSRKEACRAVARVLQVLAIIDNAHMEKWPELNDKIHSVLKMKDFFISKGTQYLQGLAQTGEFNPIILMANLFDLFIIPQMAAYLQSPELLSILDLETQVRFLEQKVQELTPEENQTEAVPDTSGDTKIVALYKMLSARSDETFEKDVLLDTLREIWPELNDN